MARVALAALDLVLPARCAACHEPGAPLCRGCRAQVHAASFPGGAAEAGPDPPPRGMPACWAGARFQGALRDAVTAYKDEDRRDLAPVLADGLAVPLAAALGADPVLRRQGSVGGQVLVVPLPSSRAARRRRGDDPVGDLARLAVERVGSGGRGGGEARLVVAPALRLVRRVVDQSTLGRDARAANLSGALALRSAWARAVDGSTCVIVDDVVTTGATLAEAARVLRLRGARHVVAVALASTPRRAGGPALVGRRRAD